MPIINPELNNYTSSDWVNILAMPALILFFYALANMYEIGDMDFILPMFLAILAVQIGKNQVLLQKMQKKRKK
jgi:hypothetical protein